MRKRAAALHGRLDFVSAPGKGTLLTMTVPLERKTLLAAVRGTAAGVLDKLRAWRTGVHRRKGNRLEGSQSRSSKTTA
jgi:hypothetical protein